MLHLHWIHMLKRLTDYFILGAVSVVYSMAVFCLKRRHI